MQIFHIARAAEWQAARVSGSYTVSTRTASLADEGFIHASTQAQVAVVADRFYRDETAPLVVLVLNDVELESAGTPVRYEEAADGERYPHIYGAIIPGLVQDARPARFDQSGRFVF